MFFSLLMHMFPLRKLIYSQIVYYYYTYFIIIIYYLSFKANILTISVFFQEYTEVCMYLNSFVNLKRGKSFCGYLGDFFVFCKAFMFKLTVSIICFLKNRMFLSVPVIECSWIFGIICNRLNTDKYKIVYSYIGLKSLKDKLLRTKMVIFLCQSDNTPKHF